MREGQLRNLKPVAPVRCRFKHDEGDGDVGEMESVKNAATVFNYVLFNITFCALPLVEMSHWHLLQLQSFDGFIDVFIVGNDGYTKHLRIWVCLLFD